MDSHLGSILIGWLCVLINGLLMVGALIIVFFMLLLPIAGASGSGVLFGPGVECEKHSLHRYL